MSYHDLNLGYIFVSIIFADSVGSTSANRQRGCSREHRQISTYGRLCQPGAVPFYKKVC